MLGTYGGLFHCDSGQPFVDPYTKLDGSFISYGENCSLRIRYSQGLSMKHWHDFVSLFNFSMYFYEFISINT